MFCGQMHFNHYQSSSRLLLEIFLFSWHLSFSYGNKAPLLFMQEPENIIAVTGKNVNFYCEANAADQKVTYLWKFNRSYVNEGNGFHASNGFLRIYNVNGVKHSGTYECMAFTKDLGVIKSKAARLQIAYLYRETFPSETQSVRFEQAYLLQAPTYKAVPEPTYTWQKKKFDENNFDKMNISYYKDLFLTSQGHLLFSSFKLSYEEDYRVLVSHPTSDRKDADFALIRLILAARDENTCSVSSLKSFPTVQNKTVVEGSNVSFECLIVSKSCSAEVLIKWTKTTIQEESLNERGRRLVLTGVTKKTHEGTYKCLAEVAGKGDKMNLKYFLNVKEKPKLVKGVSPNISLPEDGILHPAVFDKTTSLKWYKDGYVIDNSSLLFEVFANGSLRIKNPSPAFNGIYQMFFENQAGIVVVSQEVKVNHTANCGWKVTGLNGTIFYSGSDVKCTLLFQVPSTDFFQFNITTYSFRTSQRKKATLSFYDGSTASGSPVAKYYFNTTTPSPVAGVYGPFITMILHRTDSNNGGFTLVYGPRPRAPRRTTTTLAPTTAPTTAPTNTPTSKPTTTKPGPTSKNLMTSTSSKSSTGKTTDPKTTTGKISITVTVPRKKPQKKGFSSVGAILGGIIGALVLVIVLLIIYRKKLSGKFGLNILQDQRSSHNRADSQRAYPDVVPKMRPFVSEMSHLGPGKLLVGENAGYEPTERYDTRAAAAAAIYEVIDEDIRYTPNTGRNFPPPTQMPPKPTKAPPRPPEPFYDQVREEFNPFYESAEGLTRSIEDAPMPAPNPTHYRYDADEILYAKPFDSSSKR